MDSEFLVLCILLASIVATTSENNEGNLSNHEMNSNFKHPLSFVNDLSELPLEKLLQVKKSLYELKQTNFQENDSENNEPQEESLESRTVDDGNFFSNLHGRNFGKGVAALTDDKGLKR